MPKTRCFLLTLKDTRPVTAGDMAEVEKSSARILDRAGRTLKIEAPDQDPDQLSAKLPGWHVQEELQYPVPDTRRRVEHPPANPDCMPGSGPER